MPRHDFARWPKLPQWLTPEEEWRQSTFAEFLILSMLLHLLGILLFGSTSGSGTPSGKAYWGTLAVTLPFPLAAPGIGLRFDRSGDLSVPRIAPRTRPDTARDTLPRVAPEAPNIVVKPILPAAPQATPLPEAQRLPLPVTEKPLVPAPMLERIVPLKVEREIAAPVELRASEVPLVPTQTLERITPPAVAQPIAPPVELRPSEVPLVPTQTLERITPPAITQPLAPPVELRPSEVPLVPTQSLERIAPSPVTREMAAPAAELAPAEPRAAPAPAQPAARAAPREVITAPMPGPVRSRTAPPDVVDDPFSSRTPPAASEPAKDAPRFDLEAMRQRARDITKEGTGQRAILPFPMPAKPAQKSREEIAIENSWKPDCKTAYAGMGLLAMVPLMMNAFGEGTCSWNR